MKANKKVILVCGVIGSGKDYYAQQYILDNPDESVGIYKLSNKLKDLAELEFGKIDDYEAFKLKNREWLQNKADEMKTSVRQDGGKTKKSGRRTGNCRPYA